tara:strand:+ start:23 stop:352 length:330 start_codon:yes stop_codon:yes gene_type:complete
MDQIRKIQDSKWRLEQANLLRAARNLEPLKIVRDLNTGLWTFERQHNIKKRISDAFGNTVKRAKEVIEENTRKRKRTDGDGKRTKLNQRRRRRSRRTRRSRRRTRSKRR